MKVRTEFPSSIQKHNPIACWAATMTNELCSQTDALLQLFCKMHDMIIMWIEEN